MPFVPLEEGGEQQPAPPPRRRSGFVPIEGSEPPYIPPGVQPPQLPPAAPAAATVASPAVGIVDRIKSLLRPAAGPEPSAEELATASRPALMTQTRGGQPVVEANTAQPDPVWRGVRPATIASIPEHAELGLQGAVARVTELFNRSGALERERVVEQADTPNGPGYRIPPSTIAKVARKAAEERAAAERASIIGSSVEGQQEAITLPGQSTLESAITSLAQSSLPTLGGLGLGLVGGGVPAGAALAGLGGGLMQGGSTYGEAMKKLLAKGLPEREAHMQAARAAGIDALLEGGGEAAPFAIIFGKGGSFGRKLLKTSAAEAGQEGVTQLAQDFHAYSTYHPELTAEEAWKNFKVAVLSGAIGGGVYGTVGHAVERGRESAGKDAIAGEFKRVIDEGELPPAAPLRSENLRPGRFAPIESPVYVNRSTPDTQQEEKPSADVIDLFARRPPDDRGPPPGAVPEIDQEKVNEGLDDTVLAVGGPPRRAAQIPPIVRDESLQPGDTFNHKGYTIGKTRGGEVYVIRDGTTIQHDAGTVANAKATIESLTGDEPLTVGGPSIMDRYEGFKSVTGKYPWEMPYEQFFKATVSRLKNAVPGKPGQWYDKTIRTEWMKAQDAGGVLAVGGPPLEGNLGIARRDMPQIRSRDNTEFRQFAEARGIKVTPDRVPVLKLRAAQKEVNAEQAGQLPPDALKKPVMISADGYILDGTNRWARMREENPDAEIDVIRLEVPVKGALDLMRSFPKAGSKDIEQVGASTEEEASTVPKIFVEDPAFALTDAQRDAFQRAKLKLTSQSDAMVDTYLRDHAGPQHNVVNADDAKELFEDFSSSPSIHSPSVHEPASAIAKAAYTRLLNEPLPEGREPVVLITAGGSGAGKSVGLSSNPDLDGIRSRAHVVLDTTLSGTGSAVKKIDEALAADHYVLIVYTLRDPADAMMNGVLPRAAKVGRTVPILTHIQQHEGALRTIKDLGGHYAGNPRVMIRYIDNRHGWGKAREISKSAIDALTLKVSAQELANAVHAAHQAGEVGEAVYRVTLGSLQPEGVQRQGDGGARDQSQRSDERSRRAEEEADALTVGVSEGGGARGEVSPLAGLLEDEGGDPSRPFGKRPKPGDPFVVFRLGRIGSLDNRNAGNAAGVAEHLTRLDDQDSPQPKGGSGNTIFAYKVVVNEPFGSYEGVYGASPMASTKAGRQALSGGRVAYSFPAGAKWTAELVGKVPLDRAREILKQRGLASFDDAGTIEGAKAIRDAFTPELAVGGPIKTSVLTPAEPGKTNRFDVQLSSSAPIYERIGYRGLDDDEQRVMSAALDDLVKNGVPEWLIQQVGSFITYPPSKSGHGGLYFPDQAEAIAISEDVFAEERSRTLRKFLAHELGHAMDRNVDQEGHRTPLPLAYRAAGNKYYERALFASAASGSLEIEAGYFGIKPKGVLAEEILRSTRPGSNADWIKLRDHFSYPLDLFFSGQITELANRIELMAQTHALYFTEPELVRAHLPRWFRVMEQTYGPRQEGFDASPSRSRAEAHARLREALQNAGAELTGARGVGRDNDARGYAEALARFHSRGPPGGGVGAGARADQLAAGGPDVAGGARQDAGGDGVEPWRMTRDQYVASFSGQRVRRTGFQNRIGTLLNAHKEAVEAAIQLNRPVPAEVLADYPNLTRPPITVGGPPAGTRGNAYWDFDEPGLRDNFIREWQNNKIDLKHVQEQILRFGGVLYDRNNAYLAEERYHGRVSALLKKFSRDLVTPMLKEIKDSNVTIEEVGRYLWARHAPERNAQMARINPGGPANLSGMYDDAAAATAAGQPGALNAADILAGFRTAGKSAALSRVARHVDGITGETRALIVREGLEEQGTVNNWQRVYSDYVPLMRDSEDAFAKTGSGFAIKGPESKRAMGSQREAVAIVAAVIAQHERAIIRAEKAETGRALIKLAEDNPNPDFWRVDSPPTKRSINKSTGLVEVGIDPMYRTRDDVFIVKEPDANGHVKERVLVFNPQSERAMKLAAAMKNLDVVQLSGLTKVVGRVTRVLANLATSWNPLFWATNFARDVQTAGVNLQSTPLQGHAPQVISNIHKAIAGIMSAEFRNGTGRWATIYREFQENGGQTGWMTLFDQLVDRQKELEAEIKASQRGTLNPARLGAATMDIIDKVNGAIENGTRLAAYAEARDIGMTPRAAASLAKNLTVNFNRKGNRSTATNAWYMFVNANVQGTARLIQAVATSRRAQAYVGLMVALGAALELVNRLIGDGDRDDDGSNPYELVPEYEKQKNLILMLPGGKKAKLPLPYGFNVFHNAGRMMMEGVLQASGSDLVDEKKKPLDVAWNFAQVLIDSFLPLGQASSLPQLIAPSVLDPAVQYAENKTWFGSPMRPEPMQYGPPTPNHKLYFRTTSETAKDISKWLNDVTGGDEIKGGSIDVSPTTLTHVFTTVTGGTGRFGLGMFDFSKHMVGRALGTEEAEDLPWNKVPFVGTFYGEITDRERAAKFYRLRKEAFEVEKQVKAYKKTGEFEKAAELEADKPELAAMARTIAGRDFKRSMKEEKAKLKEIDAMPADERARAKRELATEEAGIMSEALRAYNERLKETRP